MCRRMRLRRCSQKNEFRASPHSLYVHLRISTGASLAMTTNFWLSVAAIFLLLCFSAFFAGSETALTTVSKARMHHLANEGSRAARHVNYLIEHRERMIGALLLGNTFVNILSSAFATSISLAILD